MNLSVTCCVIQVLLDTRADTYLTHYTLFFLISTRKIWLSLDVLILAHTFS